jgi:hypothetical protein
MARFTLHDALLATAMILSGAVFTLPEVAAQVITQDSYFYGQSPPVYPSRKSLYIKSGLDPLL